MLRHAMVHCALAIRRFDRTLAGLARPSVDDIGAPRLWHRGADPTQRLERSSGAGATNTRAGHRNSQRLGGPSVSCCSTKYSYLRLMSNLGGICMVSVAVSLNVAAETEGSVFSPVCIAIVALAFGSGPGRAGDACILAERAQRACPRRVKEECADGIGNRCTKLWAVEDQKRAALAAFPAPMSHFLAADATGLPEWLVEIVSC